MDRVPLLVEQGLLVRRGRVYFGDLDAIQAWLGGNGMQGKAQRQAEQVRELDQATYLVQGVAEETGDDDLAQAAEHLRRLRASIAGRWAPDDSGNQ
jgi:hypothetical protein